MLYGHRQQPGTNPVHLQIAGLHARVLVLLLLDGDLVAVVKSPVILEPAVVFVRLRVRSALGVLDVVSDELLRAPPARLEAADESFLLADDVLLFVLVLVLEFKLVLRVLHLIVIVLELLVQVALGVRGTEAMITVIERQMIKNSQRVVATSPTGIPL